MFYNNLIIFVVVAFFMSRVSFSNIVKLCGFGAYIILLTFSWFMYSLVQADIDWANLGGALSPRWWGSNQSAMIGAMITGFMCHPTVMPVIRGNRAFDNVKVNLMLGYTMV
mmetsp:Transcript_58729/g.127530  ORF Transcript_58729/g.127530 Transcript_58729/m.127530 type:complete len:111 (+) Transcript_58729:747-1079(+)